jgi:GNAT superfamily N-acetyltransferase
MRLDFVFRTLNVPVPAAWAPGVHWQVEAYPVDIEYGHPLGICWVSDQSVRRPPDWRGGEFPPSIDYVLVADPYRRKGIATHLIQACQERWPTLDIGEAVSEAGQALLESLRPNARGG